MSTTTIFPCDCLDAMALLMDPNSVDAIVTDPPYGIEFMGQHWDKGVPGVDYWRAAYRVVKPGGYLLAFGGSRTYHRMACAIEDAGFEMRDCLMWLYGSGFPKSLNGAWGGTALKPAHEPIVMARKPLDGTVAANVARWGTGGLNIDGCRVKGEEWSGNGVKRGGVTVNSYGNGLNNSGRTASSPLGRWPANLIHDGSDEVLAAFPDAPGQQRAASNDPDSARTRRVYGRMKRADAPMQPREDSGSAARFFYCAKASRSEREQGVQSAAGGPRGNTHPTVKPVALMRYLCRLVTPAGGVVFDPFTGSGSTGVAAKLEGFNFIGCEREDNYAAVAEARIRAS